MPKGRKHVRKHPPPPKNLVVHLKAFSQSLKHRSLSSTCMVCSHQATKKQTKTQYDSKTPNTPPPPTCAVSSPLSDVLLLQWVSTARARPNKTRQRAQLVLHLASARALPPPNPPKTSHGTMKKRKKDRLTLSGAINRRTGGDTSKLFPHTPSSPSPATNWWWSDLLTPSYSAGLIRRKRTPRPYAPSHSNLSRGGPQRYIDNFNPPTSAPLFRCLSYSFAFRRSTCQRKAGLYQFVKICRPKSEVGVLSTYVSTSCPSSSCSSFSSRRRTPAEQPLRQQRRLQPRHRLLQPSRPQPEFRRPQPVPRGP